MEVREINYATGTPNHMFSKDGAVSGLYSNMLELLLELLWSKIFWSLLKITDWKDLLTWCQQYLVSSLINIERDLKFQL